MTFLGGSCWHDEVKEVLAKKGMQRCFGMIRGRVEYTIAIFIRRWINSDNTATVVAVAPGTLASVLDLAGGTGKSPGCLQRR